LLSRPATIAGHARLAEIAHNISRSCAGAVLAVPDVMRTLWLWLPFAIALAGCTDDTAPLHEQSGTRLQLMDASWILDTELARECVFQRTSGNAYVCAPADPVVTERLVHAKCEWQLADAPIVPTYLVADDGLVVHHQFHDTAGDFDCQLDAGGICQPSAD
jgi:hypothetical protein